jgi:hypothetical protein
MSNQRQGKPGYRLIFVKYYTRNGVRVYPKTGKAFPLWVKN